MVMNKNVWVHGHDQRSWTAIIEFVTLLKTYILEEHGYIQRSAFIYCNDLSGLYNLPATPKISTTTSLRTSLNQPTECTTPHFWSGQVQQHSTISWKWRTGRRTSYLIFIETHFAWPTYIAVLMNCCDRSRRRKEKNTEMRFELCGQFGGLHCTVDDHG